MEERWTVFCGTCGTELVRNEILMSCPHCKIVDFTEQGEAKFPEIAEICRRNEFSVVDVMKALNGV